MHKSLILAASAAALVLAACSEKPAGTAQAPAAAPAKVVSFQEIMLTQVDAAADEIWQSVAFINDENGARELRPETDADWLRLRRAAVLLAESPHTWTTDRPMKSTRTDLPELDAAVDLAAVKSRIEANRPGFDAMAKTMQDVSVQLIAAIDAKNADTLLDLGGPLHQSCEACHEAFYYPPDPAEAAAPAPATK